MEQQQTRPAGGDSEDDGADDERTSFLTQWREMSHILVPIVLVSIAMVWLASRFIEPAPPRSFVMSTGGTTGAYYAFGQRYASIIARSGIKVDVRSSAGSVENVRRLADPASNVSVALLQGGITDARTSANLMSLGRLFLEPVWLFYRGDETIDRLSQLSGRRIAIGPEGSGTRALAESVFKPSGLVAAGTTLSPLTGQAAVDAMGAGQLDAVVLVMAPEAPLVQALLRDDRFKLMSFAQADAYTRMFPYLERVVLPQGVVDLVANRPARDVVMLAATTTLIARNDLHPALVGLLVDAVQEVHAGSGLFHRAGDFPRQVDPEFPMSDDAVRVYRSGQSFLKRHLPFWLATFIERTIVLAVPLATILFPVFKLAPKLYQWRIRRRILHWYQQLKRLERRMIDEQGRTQVARFREEIDRIEHAVSTIPVPITFSEQLFNLRAAVQLVRQKVYTVV